MEKPSSPPNLELNSKATKLEDGSLVFYPQQISSLFPPLYDSDSPEQWKNK